MKKEQNWPSSEYQKKIDEAQKEVKKRTVLESMKSLIDTKLDGKNITLKPWKEWNYKPASSELYYVESDLVWDTTRWVFGSVLHNMWHGLFTNLERSISALRAKAELVPEEIKEKQHFYTLLTALEDNRVEEQMIETYPWVYDNFYYKFKRKDNKIAPAIESQLPRAIQYTYSLARQFWWESLANVKPEVKEALIETEEALEKVYLEEDVYWAISTCIDEIRPVYKRLLDEDKKENNDEGQSSSKEINEMCKALIDQSDMDLMESKMMQASQWLSEEEALWWAEWAAAKPDYGKWEESLAWVGWWDESESEWDGKSQKYWQRDPVLWQASKWHEEPKLAREDFLSYEVMYSEIAPYIPYFKRKLQSIMKDNRYNREGGSYRSGKLNSKKLYRWAAGNDKLFTRKVIRRHKDYKVTLLVDLSGSMTSDSKNRHAAKGTILLAEVLNSVWIDFEIRWFNAYDFLFKKFWETFWWKQRRQLERIILESHSHGAWCNNDWRAVRKASHHIRKEWGRETERMVIVLSDGLPAPDSSFNKSIKWEEKDDKIIRGSKSSYWNFNLHYEIEEAVWKWILCIWIGINARHVTDYYKENVICNDVSWLPVQLLQRLKKSIKRG